VGHGLWGLREVKLGHRTWGYERSGLHRTVGSTRGWVEACDMGLREVRPTRGRAEMWDVGHTVRAYGEVRLGVQYTNLPSPMF
jgi:hypothetical protein